MPNIGKKQYIQRQGRACAEQHFNICKEIGVKLDNKHWYDHVQKSAKICHENKVTIFWNQQVQTNRSISTNKPDTIIRDNRQGTCMLIDVAIPVDRNVIQKESEKILKYKDLIIQIHGIWNVKAKVILVMIGVTGTIS